MKLRRSRLRPNGASSALRPPKVGLFLADRSAAASGSTPPDGLYRVWDEACRNWWRRSQSIRTKGEVPFEAVLVKLSEPPVYQRIAEKAFQLNQLGMNPNRIAVHLGVDRTTVTRAQRWLMSESAYRPRTSL